MKNVSGNILNQGVYSSPNLKANVLCDQGKIPFQITKSHNKERAMKSALV